jgi:hypothetical protein
MQRLQTEGVACAAIDMTAIGTSDITPEQWYAGVIYSLVSSLDLYETFDLEVWWTERKLLSYVQRFSQFVEEVLLEKISQPIVIFVDEIDSIISLKFNIDDFFAVIRDCYNKRADNPKYRRLAFALIGVATPSDLIQDKRRTPFNIGRAIELNGFQLHEAEALVVGLAKVASNPQSVLQAVLDWTGGQPFLTQKICKLLSRAESQIPEGSEVACVEQLVRSHIISNWEAQDEPEHLKTIRDRILRNEQRAGQLLGLYQQILQQEIVSFDGSPEQMELRLSGLVVTHQGQLKVYNLIYKSVFNLTWVEKKLAELRPYGEALAAWLASNCQDTSRLLRGQALREALAWSANKNLSHDDYRFLTLSQDLDRRDDQIALDKLREERRRILNSASYVYQLGGYLSIDNPSYIVRQADFDLYSGLKAGEFCYVLNSRQMGKSSLRVRTMHRLQAEGVACAAIDIAAIGAFDITPEQWYAGVIYSIVSSLELYESFDLEDWWLKHSLLGYVQRFSLFIEEVLLPSIHQQIVIFVDEIDSILSLNFNSDDFFVVIRDCYNKRADHPEYRRLTFVLIGVATTSDLIADKRRTPFNIGRAIELTGFQLHEAQPLAVGLAQKASNPQNVLQEVLDWTEGQPFLTQKVCKLIRSAESTIPEGSEQEWVEELVRRRIISNWESQDEPEHLKTIRDRILCNEQRASCLLGLYQQILQEGEVAASDSSEQMELWLMGLVVKREGKLRVNNRIYQNVFDQCWVEQALANLRPYAEAITAWLASDCQDESRLLHGQALQEAIEWRMGKSLSYLDVQFLDASRELEKREFQRALEAAQKAKQLLEVPQKRAKRTIRIRLAVLATALVGAIAAVIVAGKLEIHCRTTSVVESRSNTEKSSAGTSAGKREIIAVLSWVQYSSRSA